MLNTLYKKLTAILFIVLCLVGSVVFALVLYATDMYQQEVTQRLNKDLATQILTENLLLKDGQVDQQALKQVIHMLMVINPSIEVYLLDTQGKILAYSAPQGKVKRQFVNIEPVKQFVTTPKRLPYFGDDPRDFDREKIFSAAAITGDKGVAGYVYVILAGEAVDSAAAMIKESYILRYSLAGLVSSLVIAMLFGLIMFSFTTRRITRLSNAMTAFVAGNDDPQPNRYPATPVIRDEVDQLGSNFNRMAERIEQQMNELKQNDAKRRELIANVSHDLRTPLTSLHGYIETLLMKESQLSEEERRDYLKTAANHSQQLSRLIDELFELAKLDSVETLLNIEPFSLAELAQDVAHSFKLAADKNHITLKTEFGSNVPFAYGDIALIQRVLENLIENAMRHTPQGGEISLSLSAKNENIIVSISDTGCGIKKEDVPHIFDRFYRATKSRENGDFHSGLGLAIVKRIVSLHGSDIQADSELDKGTTFTFQLATSTRH
ncbi:MAG: HAMP domain-containing histidine kinase [Gammaproteobacteria bacterium]|nr:HAMP domain-containing histidine kinase [Gammaproteobacteria bacterium]